VRQVVQKQPRRRHRSEGTAANHDYIESARPSGNGHGCTVGRFLQRIAQEAAHIIERKSGNFRR
jgi:hypothetical protein